MSTRQNRRFRWKTGSILAFSVSAFWGWYVAGSLAVKREVVYDDRKVPNRPACTPKHKSTWVYSNNTTLTPIVTLPAACTKP
jgi:hypothetical protein